MKTRITTISSKNTKTPYVADDGAEFDTADQCKIDEFRMSDYISSARKNLEQLGYKRYTVGISHTLKKAFQAGKSIDAAVSEIQGIFMPDGFLMPGCYYKPEGDGTFVKGDSMHQKETLETSDAENPVDPVESPVTPVKPPVDPEMAISKDTMLEAFLNSVKEKVKVAGYSHYTVGMEILAKEAFNLNKSVDDTIAWIREYISIDDSKCVDPRVFAPHCRPALDIPMEPNPPVDPGVALFEAYVTAKQNLTEKLNTVLQILAACNALELEQGDRNYIASYIGKNAKDIASHQWRYVAGHEKIFCQHTYSPQGATSFTSTMIKVPVKYLGMSDEEIWADNENNAIKALEEKKASYERKRSEILKPIDEKISGVDKQIKMLKAHQIVGKNGERE